MNKQDEYAVKILSVLQDHIFSEEGDQYISLEELKEGDNLTLFHHALVNIVPTQFYNTITGKNKDILEMNHNANKLCFQFCQPKSKEENT